MNVRRTWAAVLLWIFLASFVAVCADEGIVERIVACASCHGEQGQSRNETYYPSIAGKPEGYLFSQLKNFRDGRRYHEIMSPMLATLADDYLREIAHYYSQQTPVWIPPEVGASDVALNRGRRLVEHGDARREIPACVACHDESLKGMAPWIPGLLGVRPEYLSAQLGAWRTGARRSEAPDCMAAIAQRLDREDISAVAVWIARKELPSDPAPSNPNERLPLACGTVR